jgi:hypothetical protein
MTAVERRKGVHHAALRRFADRARQPCRAAEIWKRCLDRLDFVGAEWAGFSEPFDREHEGRLNEYAGEG